LRLNYIISPVTPAKNIPMKKFSIIFLLLGSVVLLTLCRCATEQKKYSVTPPLQQVDVGFSEFEIDAKDGGTITSSTGSTIVVPGGAFTDENGNVYSGKVNLLFREFHHAADILASGIPMRYDSGGTTIDFETAGMFEINAMTPDNKQLLITPGRNLTVNMASYVNGNEYNFYALAKDGSGWQYNGTNAPVKNEKKQKMLAELPPKTTSPVKPREQDPKQKVFDISFDESQHPELKGFAGVVWQYAGAPGEAGMDPALNPWVFKYNWTKVELGAFDPSSMTYDLTLSGPGKVFSTVVSPVLQGKKLLTAMKEFEEKFKKYNEEMEKRSESEKLAERQGDFMRSFSVANFGIYNWDRALKQPERIIASAKIDFDQDVEMKPEDLVVYLITASDRSLVTYTYSTLGKFSFDPKQQNKLVVILPGNKIALLDEKEFAKVDAERVRNEKTCSFILHVQKSGVKTMNDLYSALNTPRI
jgi:hypothetical protein